MRSTKAPTPRPRPAWLLLHGADVNPTRPVRPRSRIVLLHGWLQSHTAWLPTALALRDLYGHSVLLLDFYGHGLSHAPSSAAMSPAGWTQLVEDRVAAIGWDRGAPLVLGGCSLGAAVCYRYTLAHPDRVSRLVLVTPAGLPEPPYMPCHPVGSAARTVCSMLPDTARWADALRVIVDTPEYGVDVEAVIELAAQGRCRLFVYGAGLDIVHSPRATYWKSVAQRLATAAAATPTTATATAATTTATPTTAAATAATTAATPTAATPTTAAAVASAAATGCASSQHQHQLHSAQLQSPVQMQSHQHQLHSAQMQSPVQMQSPRRASAVRYTYLTGRTHWGVCSDLYGLGLHEDEELWHDRAAPERSRL